MCVKAEVIDGLIERTTINGVWTYGGLWEILKLMRVDYYGSDLLAETQVRSDLLTVKMHYKDEDPELLFQRLSKVQGKYALRPKIKPTYSQLLILNFTRE
mmetsp:Transcript_6443/g.13265  ORF Transcript_6443/g.13265 Transcript_6443/m.13265 type:complete len:100 (-) Transcript_6443:66-365(-)